MPSDCSPEYTLPYGGIRGFRRFKKMIPFHKLEKLPRSLRFRKIVKHFGEVEQCLHAGAEMPPEDFFYLRRLLGLLAEDAALPAEARAVITALPKEPPPAGGELLRTVNALRHILLAETGRFPADWDFIGPGGGLDPRKRRIFPGMWVYLEDIRAPFNVGAMFRTAESFGAEKILLSPLCADPHHPRAERTAMGCEQVLAWERLTENIFPKPETAEPFAEKPPAALLKENLFALETGGTPLRKFRFPKQGVMIVGSEELGVSPGALSAADASCGRVSIPTCGAKGSLNASVAFGIALQAWAETLWEGYA